MVFYLGQETMNIGRHSLEFTQNGNGFGLRHLKTHIFKIHKFSI
jgi:hypothetical protein